MLNCSDMEVTTCKKKYRILLNTHFKPPKSQDNPRIQLYFHTRKNLNQLIHKILSIVMIKKAQKKHRSSSGVVVIFDKGANNEDKRKVRRNKKIKSAQSFRLAQGKRYKKDKKIKRRAVSEVLNPQWHVTSM